MMNSKIGVNEYFNKLLVDSGYHFVVLFKNYKGKPLNKERKFKIPDFFKSDDIAEELFVVCEPTIVKRRYKLYYNRFKES